MIGHRDVTFPFYDTHSVEMINLSKSCLCTDIYRKIKAKGPQKIWCMVQNFLLKKKLSFMFKAETGQISHF